jgi:hypothetical protein
LEFQLKGGNVTLQIGQEQLIRVVNKTGVDIANGTCVYLDGAQGQRPKVSLAKANAELTSGRTLGVVTETIVNNQEGFVTTQGLVRDIDLSDYDEGDTLYLSPITAGAFTKIEPSAPNHNVFIGIVVVANPNGVMWCHPQNGYELDELHDVKVTNKQNLDILQYDSGSLYWKNVAASSLSVATASYSLTSLSSSYATTSSYAFLSNTASYALSAGTATDNTRLALTGGTLSGNVGMTGASSYLGIGITTPSAPLDIRNFVTYRNTNVSQLQVCTAPGLVQENGALGSADATILTTYLGKFSIYKRNATGDFAASDLVWDVDSSGNVVVEKGDETVGLIKLARIGKVGIGTTSPQTPLDVRGVTTYRNTGVTQLQVGIAPALMQENGALGANDFFVISTYNGKALFYKGNRSGSLATSDLKMTIDSSGKLQLGGSAGLDYAIATTAILHLPSGSTAASTAPLKFTSGSLMTAAEAGAVEYDGDKAYLTIATATARKEIALCDSTLTSGSLVIGTTNGRLTSLVGGLPLSLGGTGTTGSFTAGSVIFHDGVKYTQDNSYFYYDRSNKRLGVNLSGSAPSATIHSSGSTILKDGHLIFSKASGYGIKVDAETPASASFGWKDLLGDIQVRSGQLDPPTWTVFRTNVNAFQLVNAQTQVFNIFHIPHDYVPGTDMFVHVHWAQNVVDTGGPAGTPGTAEWNFDISYAKGYGTAGGSSDPFPATKTITITQQASTTQYGHMIAEVQFTNAGGDATHIDRSLIEVDGLLIIRTWRNSANAADTLNQAPFVFYVDCHYQTNGVMGTKNKNRDFYV